MPVKMPLKQRLNIIGKKLTKKPISFKEKREALGIERKVLATYPNTAKNSKFESQINREVSLHPKIRNIDANRIIATMDIDSEISRIKKTKPKSEREVILKQRLLEKLDAKRDKILSKAVSKTNVILNKRISEREDKRNKILVEKLDLIGGKGETFAQLITQAQQKYEKYSYDKSDVRASLHKIYLDYITTTPKKYTDLTKDDIQLIKNKFKQKFNLIKYL